MAAQIYPKPTLARTDIGSDTLGRFEYQATYAAILAMDLILKKDEVAEIYHEFHEDVSVKLFDGIFIAYQIKTRFPTMNPFKFNDDEILNTIKNFILLKREKPDFNKFRIVVNCGFYNENNNFSNLVYVIESYKNGVFNDEQFQSKICKPIIDRITCDMSEISFILKNLELISAPNLGDLKNNLVNKIFEYTGKTTLHSDLEKIADSLIKTMFRIGAFKYDTYAEQNYRINENSDKLIRDKIQAQKCVVREDIESIINDVLITEPSLLRYAYEIPDKPLNGLKILNKKLRKGKLSDENIDLLNHLTFSADHFFSELLAKYNDPHDAKLNRDHIRIVVNNECQEVYDTIENNDEFAFEMLKQIRKNLRKRWEYDLSKKYTCSYEHLLGVSGILTNDCNLWWSEKPTPEEIKNEFV